MNSTPIYSAELAAAVATAGSLQQQLAELREAARAYFTRSDLVTLTRDGVVAANRLASLLENAP
jgi:uncharacterized membrane protein YhhN